MDLYSLSSGETPLAHYDRAVSQWLEVCRPDHHRNSESEYEAWIGAFRGHDGNQAICLRQIGKYLNSGLDGPCMRFMGASVACALLLKLERDPDPVEIASRFEISPVLVTDAIAELRGQPLPPVEPKDLSSVCVGIAFTVRHLYERREEASEKTTGKLGILEMELVRRRRDRSGTVYPSSTIAHLVDDSLVRSANAAVEFLRAIHVFRAELERWDVRWNIPKLDSMAEDESLGGAFATGIGILLANACVRRPGGRVRLMLALLWSPWDIPLVLKLLDLPLKLGETWISARLNAGGTFGPVQATEKIAKMEMGHVLLAANSTWDPERKRDKVVVESASDLYDAVTRMARRSSTRFFHGRDLAPIWLAMIVATAAVVVLAIRWLDPIPDTPLGGPTPSVGLLQPAPPLVPSGGDAPPAAERVHPPPPGEDVAHRRAPPNKPAHATQSIAQLHVRDSCKAGNGYRLSRCPNDCGLCEFLKGNESVKETLKAKVKEQYDAVSDATFERCKSENGDASDCK